MGFVDEGMRMAFLGIAKIPPLVGFKLLGLGISVKRGFQIQTTRRRKKTYMAFFSSCLLLIYIRIARLVAKYINSLSSLCH